MSEKEQPSFKEKWLATETGEVLFVTLVAALCIVKSFRFF